MSQDFSRLLGGSLGPIGTITSLQTLSLSNTGLSGTLNDQISNLSQLRSLSLSSNQQLEINGPTLGGISDLGLTSLNLNTQSLPSNALAVLAQSESKLASTLTLLKMTSTGLSGQIPDALAQGLSGLKTLILDGNSFTSMPDPATNNGIIFPNGLTTLSVAANPGLQGVLTSAECRALQQANVKSCVFTGTSVTLETGLSNCGNCQLR
jgi:Leucine-rich repeat (LRR) protein